MLVRSLVIVPKLLLSMACRFSDFQQDVWSLYNLEFGDQMGKSTSWPSLDEVYRVCLLSYSAYYVCRLPLGCLPHNALCHITMCCARLHSFHVHVGNHQTCICSTCSS